MQQDFGFAGTAQVPATRHLIRATRREADWRRQLAQALAYATNQSPEQAEELLAEYERRERAGPDFMRQRPDSVITAAPVINLDRNERVRLITTFRALTRRTWVNKETGRHRGAVSRTCEAVFGALLYLATKYGRVHPSLTGLAHLAMCCRASVVTALADLEDKLGFVTRIRRLRRIKTPLGFETVQETNAYLVHRPMKGLGFLAVALFASNAESNFQPPSVSKVSNKEPAHPLNPESPLAQALVRLGMAVKKDGAPNGATSLAMK
jgi:hypothetical protein